MLSGFYLLLFLSVCCSLISVTLPLTNLFDKSTLEINEARLADENEGRGKAETEGRLKKTTTDRRKKSIRKHKMRTEGGGIKPWIR